MLPIIVAQLVVLLKDTALGYIVGNIDLIRRGRLLAEFFGAGQYALSIFFVMLAMYLTINFTISAIARGLAKQRGQKLDPITVKDAGSGSL
jgi:glutamate transport system permease protein